MCSGYSLLIVFSFKWELESLSWVFLFCMVTVDCECWIRRDIFSSVWNSWLCTALTNFGLSVAWFEANKMASLLNSASSYLLAVTGRYVELRLFYSSVASGSDEGSMSYMFHTGAVCGTLTYFFICCFFKTAIKFLRLTELSELLLIVERRSLVGASLIAERTVCSFCMLERYFSFTSTLFMPLDDRVFCFIFFVRIKCIKFSAKFRRIRWPDVTDGYVIS